MLPLLALSTALAAAPATGAALLHVPGADDECCAEKVVAALRALPFVQDVGADPATGRVCVTLSGAPDEPAARAALTAAGGYTVESWQPIETCPEGLKSWGKADPWAGAAGLDVAIISRGEEVDLAAHRAQGKATLFDFSAAWCAPCHASAARLRQELAANPGLAVRIIELGGADATASFNQPVAAQHMQWAEGLPYFVVLNAKGKAVYKGSDLDAALKAAR